MSSPGLEKEISFRIYSLFSLPSDFACLPVGFPLFLVFTQYLYWEFKENRTSHILLDSFLQYCSQDRPRYIQLALQRA